MDLQPAGLMHALWEMTDEFSSGRESLRFSNTTNVMSSPPFLPRIPWLPVCNPEHSLQLSWLAGEAIPHSTREKTLLPAHVSLTFYQPEPEPILSSGKQTLWA